MTGLTRVRLLASAALLLLCLTLIAPVGAASAAYSSEPAYTKESQQAYERQLAAGEIADATFNKLLRSLRVTLKNGEHVLYHYPKKGSEPLEAGLKAKHIPVTILKPSEAAQEKQHAKKPGHKLRYIVGGVLIVVLLVVGGVLAFNRSRAAREE